MDNRERAKVRDKKQWTPISSGEKHENFIAGVRRWERLAATEVKMSGSKKKVNENTSNISSIKRVTRKFHVIAVQNNGKQMYIKSVLYVQTGCFRCRCRFPLRDFIFYVSKL